MQVTLWSGVAVAMQSVIGADLTITTITKANPGVVTSNAHGLANGDYVLLVNVQGMYQLNNRVVRVSGVSTNSFNLEGIDTTLFNTFVSGVAKKITFGTSFSTLLDISAAGGDSPDVDTTTIHDLQRSSIPGIAAASVFTFNAIWDVADAGMLAAKAASDIKAQRAVLFTFQNGQKYVFNGYVSCNLAPNGTAQEKVTTPFKLTANGIPQTYAT